MTTTETILHQTIQRCREQKLILPTYSQMRNPETVPETIQKELSQDRKSVV